MRIMTIVGARPQFVKAAMVSRALAAHDAVTELVVHTGQHYDDGLSAVFFRQLGIPDPAINLGIGSGPHGEQTGRMLAEIERVMLDVKPDIALVYGDTNSTLAGSLAAAKLHIPIAHVEAGLRSFNMRMPEEINRILTDRLSSLLFTPSENANQNLLDEGIPSYRVHTVGDVMVDAALFARAQMKENGSTSPPYVLVTIHRAENTDDGQRLAVIVEAMNRIAGESRVIFPIHPRTRQSLSRTGLTLSSRVELCDPLGYFEMMRAEAGAQCIVTDSGGVQKEAFFHRVPCVTLRDETEWVELVELGWNTVVPPNDINSVVSAIRAAPGSRPQNAPPIYGDGRAGERIAKTLVSPLVQR